jgi:RHS repeat-associated protein
MPRAARLLLFVLIAFALLGSPAATAQETFSGRQATGAVRSKPLLGPTRLLFQLPDATDPADPINDQPDPFPDPSSGPIIEYENQTLVETVPVVGTPFQLYYASNRVPGRTAANAIDIALSGSEVPANLVRVDLRITVAGIVTLLSFPPLPNQSYHFVWDGTTAAGAHADRRQPYTVDIGYVYSPARSGAASTASTAAAAGRRRAVSPPAELRKEISGYVGAWNAVQAGFGGWTLDVSHFYDRETKLFYYGDGTTRDLSLLGVSANATTYPSPDGSEVYDLDDAGRHVRTRDAMTGAVKFTLTYDTSGQLTTVADRNGLTTTIERNSAGDPTAIVAPGGQRTTLSIGSDGFLRDIVDPAGEGDHYTYNSGGLLATSADHRSNVYTFTWNDVGRLAKDVDPDGGSTTLTRTNTQATTTVAESTAAGRKSSIVSRRFADGDVEKIITDEAGLVTQSSRALNDSTADVLPDGTRITQQTQPDPLFGSVATYVGSSRVTLPSGRSLTVEQSRAVTPTGPTDPRVLSSAMRTITKNGRAWTSAYAASTRTWTDATPSGRISARTVDNAGRIVSARTGSLPAVSFGYDNLGRLVTTEQGGRTNRIGYNDQNYVASTTDALGQVKRFSYDAAGRATLTRLADNREIGFAYDPSGNMTAVTTPMHAVHTFTYTATGRLASYNAPSASDATRYEYNADHDLTKVTRPDGTSIVSGYDTAGRVSSVRTQEDFVRFGYEVTSGMLRSIANIGEELKFENDGPMITGAVWNGVVTGFVRRTIDADFRTAAQTVCASTCGSASFAYDFDGLLTSAGALSLQRDPQNGFVTQASAGTLAESYTYNEFGEQTGYSLTTGGVPVMKTTYGRDVLGRITTRNEQLNGASTANVYGYDVTGRLVSATTNGVAVTYSYDDNGNRLKRTSGVTEEMGDYDQQDRLLHYNGATFAYTAAGDLRSRTGSDGTSTYSYDAVGNLRHASLPNGSSVDYVIDGRDRRIGVKVNGTLVRGWIYADGLRIVAELDGAGALVSRFVYGTRLNVPDLMIRSGETYRLVTDERGSVRLVVNVNTGAIAQRLDYDEFGRVFVDTAPSFQPFGFAGGLYDPYTSFVRFGARDYDPRTGRWTTRDPIGLGGGATNVYQYVFSDPINFIDPEGKSDDLDNLLYLGNAAGNTVAKALDLHVGPKHPHGPEPIGNIPYPTDLPPSNPLPAIPPIPAIPKDYQTPPSYQENPYYLTPNNQTYAV